MIEMAAEHGDGVVFNLWAPQGAPSNARTREGRRGAGWQDP